jgi:hypothetical protein
MAFSLGAVESTNMSVASSNTCGLVCIFGIFYISIHHRPTVRFSVNEIPAISTVIMYVCRSRWS